jgi:NTP pyrophosphatase (non-canonical NTP hydrolase)
MAHSRKEFHSDWQRKLEDQIVLLRDERFRQLQKWGPQDHDDGMWLKILAEEVGEVAKAMLEKDLSNVADEAIHVAAVAIAIAQAVKTKKPV